MKFAKIAMASAVLAVFSAPAFADPPLNSADLNNTLSITNDLTVSGGAAVTGVIGVAAETGAVTDNSQASVGNLVITVGGGNTATVDTAANGVTGNVGINAASGTGNAQGNEAALASLQDASSVFASAQTFSTQVSAINANLAVLTDNAATLNNAVNGVTGNVGVNVASGSGNMQDNQLAAAVRTGTLGSGSLAKASGSNQQLVALTLNGDLDFNLTNSASITNALTGSGNIGANVAAGYGNLQHNSLSIAAAK
jgi:hypothetical protein